MARPDKNTVDYFPYICEEGQKMFYLEETYGNDGFATFVKILRELAKTNYHYLDLSKPARVMFLCAKCKVSKDILLAIINDLVDLEKFDSILWNENNIIWCQDFIDSIQDAYIKRKNKCITYDGLLDLLIGFGVRKPNKSKPKVADNTQTILENTIEEETKENKTKRELEERKLKFASTLKVFNESYDRNLLKEFYEYWTEPNKSGSKFKQELEKTWDLKRRLETWAKNDKTFGNQKSNTPQQNNSGNLIHTN